MPYSGQKRRDYQNQLHAAWRAKVIAHLGGVCAVCGTTENLEVHHKDPKEKVDNVGRMWTRRWEVQLGELAKCELLCAAHHTFRHTQPCGTAAAYHRGCRCDSCRAAHSDYRKAYRLANLEHIRRRNREWMRAHYKKKNGVPAAN